MTQGVPVSAVLGGLVLLISAICAVAMMWLRHEFTRNDQDHRSIRKVLDRITNRIDHIIRQHRPHIDPYKDDE